jgi:hypothetical protein
MPLNFSQPFLLNPIFLQILTSKLDHAHLVLIEVH